MDEPLIVPPTISPRLKSIVIRTLVWGFGFGVGVGLVVLAVMFYLERPKGWDTKSIRASNVKAETLSKLDDHDPFAAIAVPTDFVSTGNIFSADLQNATGKDITLPASVTIMQTAKETGALHSSLLRLSRNYFLPAHHTVTITLENDDECLSTVKVEDCYNGYFKDESNIVLFDQTQKYEIRIPIPPLTKSDLAINPHTSAPVTLSPDEVSNEAPAQQEAPVNHQAHRIVKRKGGIDLSAGMIPDSHPDDK